MRLQLYRGYWCIYWRENGKPRRKSLRTDDKSLAEREFREFQRRLKAPRETIGDIFPEYIEKKVPGETWTWKVLKPFWKDYRPSEITEDLCKKYIKRRTSLGIKNGTIHRELTMLRAAVRWNDKNTPAVFFFPPKPPPREKRLTKEECQRLIDAAVVPHVKLFIILALTTAARTSALLELTWDQVDFEKKEIRLAKGGESRLKGRARVPMNETAYKALKQAEKASLTDHVLERGGKPIASIRKGVVNSGKRAGLDVSPHVLRHTAASLMAENGVPMEEIGQYLGHSSSDITYRVYARYSPTYLKKASQALEFDVEADDIN